MGVEPPDQRILINWLLRQLPLYLGERIPNRSVLCTTFRAREESGVIAIVDAYHFATALNDFNVFSQQFGLPVETLLKATNAGNKVFEVVYANGGTPQINGGWNVEEALDIEWAHAMAPCAKIVLVEAASSNYKRHAQCRLSGKPYTRGEAGLDELGGR